MNEKFNAKKLEACKYFSTTIVSDDEGNLCIVSGKYDSILIEGKKLFLYDGPRVVLELGDVYEAGFEEFGWWSEDGGAYNCDMYNGQIRFYKE